MPVTQILHRQPSSTPKYDLVQVEIDDRKMHADPPKLLTCWSYTTTDYPNSVMGAGYPSKRHETPELADAHLMRMVRSWQGQGGGLSRAEYEATCAELGVEPLSDKECDSYAVQYGEFSFPEYDPERCVTMRLAARRLGGIKAERAALPKAPAPEVKMGRSDYSGQPVPEVLLMQSSLHGRVSPDEYDELESRL